MNQNIVIILSSLSLAFLSSYIGFLIYTNKDLTKPTDNAVSQRLDIQVDMHSDFQELDDNRINEAQTLKENKSSKETPSQNSLRPLEMDDSPLIQEMFLEDLSPELLRTWVVRHANTAVEYDLKKKMRLQTSDTEIINLVLSEFRFEENSTVEVTQYGAYFLVRVRYYQTLSDDNEIFYMKPIYLEYTGGTIDNPFSWNEVNYKGLHPGGLANINNYSFKSKLKPVPFVDE